MGLPNFRTSLKSSRAEYDFSHNDSIMGIGSCFVENIGKQLEEKKFNTFLNPFGIMYNPVSVAKCLEMIIDGKPLSEGTLQLEHGRWFHYDYHSQFDHTDFDTAFRQMKDAIQNGHDFLQKTNRLILTFGTAYAFLRPGLGLARQILRKQVVANCHKVAPRYFNRIRLSIDEITDTLIPVIKKLNKLLPKLQIVLTVSPVRHLKDGFIDNQKSKAVLLLATEIICKKFKNLSYFPSYEIMMDDLRDYRFYESDMLHPSSTALDYIWKFFQNTFLSESTIQLNNQITSIVKASRHRPLHLDARSELSTFAERQLKKIAALKKVNLLLDFSKEEAHFKALLDST